MRASAKLIEDEDPSCSSFSGESADLGRYLECLSYIERLHRLLLDVIKDEFERLGVADVNGVQALLLFNIGDNEVTAGELRTRGYYQGSNVSYNLKKLVDGGYIHHQRCSVDRRAVRISLTQKGGEIRRIVRDLWSRQQQTLEGAGVLTDERLADMNDGMKALERFWTEQIRYIY